MSETLPQSVASKGTVVFIDDDLLPMRYYVEAVRRRGYAARVFYGPKTALEYLRTQPEDVVLLIVDLMMPNEAVFDGNVDGLKTGWHLLRSLHRDGLLRRNGQPLPVIVYSNVVELPEPDAPLDGWVEYRKLLKDRIIKKTDCNPLELADRVDLICSKESK